MKTTTPKLLTPIITIEQASAVLARYLPAARTMTGKNITLERMAPLMKKLGNPEQRLKIVHVAGTSGKTSTAYYVASMLKGVGDVGLTVSPHIDSITERIQINGKPISEEEFCTNLTEFLNLIDGVDPEPTYFELLIAFAYWYFTKCGVAYAVIETGLGGMHDSTNIATNNDKVCVITDIGFDHMHVLGNTLPEIAAQKAGIMHAGNQAFCYRQTGEISDVFTARAASVGAHLTELDESMLDLLFTGRTTPKKQEKPQLADVIAAYKLLPNFQKRNWLLAHHVAQFVRQRDEIAPLSLAIEQESLTQAIPGRMNIFEYADKTLVLDGAHNPQKMEAFVKSFRAKYPNQKAVVLLSLKKGKEYAEVLASLKPISVKLVITTYDTDNETLIAPCDPETLLAAANECGYTDVAVAKTAIEGLDLLTKSHEEYAIVTGSFYLVSEIRRRLA